jgi:rhodanese-related sulfurtransferase
MWKPTIRGLLARRVRLVLTAMAVLLGVSFVSATFVLTDTVKDAFDSVFAQTLTGVDLQVQGVRPLGRGDPQRVPESALGDVRAVSGVGRAEGFVTGYAQFVGRDGQSIGGGGPPTIGASWVNGGPFELVDVRTEEERAIAKIEGSRLLDADGHRYLLGLDRNMTVVFQCHHGIRSQSAAEYFLREGFQNLYNVRGGIDAWSQLVDPSVPRY